MKMIKSKQVEDGDIIFFADLWFSGLEALFYVRNITGIKFKIAGVLHAGTWDPSDFTCRNGMRNWGQYIELGWLQGVDMIFVATQFHKDLIIFNSGSFNPDKIHVTGIPFYAANLKQKYPIPMEQKENIIVFPHRTDIEKHPEKFDKLAKKYPKWRFVKTILETKSREEYFQLLAKSKVMISYAEQETFGYSTVEAMALGNYVIVPNALSYRETVPKEFRYSNEKEIPEMLEKFMEMSAPAVYPELGKWADSIQNMMDIMKG
jgi:glycosyltransferase involved in cell wall biosynthesis